MFPRIAGARNVKQSGIIGGKIPFAPYIIIFPEETVKAARRE